ncbi:hypothetical protein IH992_04460 [Candidatus Poribacteria bacterium]|nr:hypothetical protein [Candidatus Poribacteria bacterium]
MILLFEILITVTPVIDVIAPENIGDWSGLHAENVRAERAIDTLQIGLGLLVVTFVVKSVTRSNSRLNRARRTIENGGDRILLSLGGGGIDELSAIFRRASSNSERIKAAETLGRFSETDNQHNRDQAIAVLSGAFQSNAFEKLVKRDRQEVLAEAANQLAKFGHDAEPAASNLLATLSLFEDNADLVLIPQDGLPLERRS